MEEKNATAKLQSIIKKGRMNELEHSGKEIGSSQVQCARNTR